MKTLLEILKATGYTETQAKKNIEKGAWIVDLDTEDWDNLYSNEWSCTLEEIKNNGGNGIDYIDSRTAGNKNGAVLIQAL